jgi:regulator of RNase E activity RraB
MQPNLNVIKKLRRQHELLELQLSQLSDEAFDEAHGLWAAGIEAMKRDDSETAKTCGDCIIEIGLFMQIIDSSDDRVKSLQTLAEQLGVMVDDFCS